MTVAAVALPYSPPMRQREPTLRLATGTVDLVRQRFCRADGAAVALTARETRLLEHLATRPGEDVDRDELLTQVWGHRSVSLSRAVDATVARLRRKIEAEPGSPRLLITVHGSGYRLVPDAAPDAPAPARPSPRPPLVLGGRVLDLATGALSDGGLLSAKERLVLERLIVADGDWVTPERLAVAVGLRRLGALATLVYRLRLKIEADPKQPAFLVSRRDLGYRLSAPVAPAPFVDEAHREALGSAARHLGLAGGVSDCVIYVRDGDHLVQVAAHGPKRGPDGRVVAPLRQALGEGLVGVAAATAAPVRVADVRGDPRYHADLVPARSELAVPILARGRVVGVIDSEDARPGHHTARHEAVFVSLAAIAAVAFPRGTP